MLRAIELAPRSTTHVMSAPVLGIRDTAKLVEGWLVEAVEEEKKLRRDSQQPLFCPAMLYQDGIEVRAICCDISRHGIRLVQSDCPPCEGMQTLTMWLNQQTIEMPVNILWTETLGGIWWASGGLTAELSTLESFELLRHQFTGKLQRRLKKRYSYCKRFFALPANEGRGYQEDPLKWSDDAVTDDAGTARLYLYRAPIETISDEDAKAVTSVMSLDISSGGVRLLSERRFFEEGRYIYLENIDRAENALVRGRIVATTELENGYHTANVEFAPSFR